MTSTIAIRIADAIAADINTAVTASLFGVSGFTAVRSYPDWDLEFKDASTLQCDVVFAPSEEINAGLDSVGNFANDVTVNVVFRKRFGATDRTAGRIKAATLDPLVTLIDEVRKFFIGKRNTGVLTGLSSVNWSGDSQIKAWYDTGSLRQGLFEGYVQLRFDAPEAI